MLVIITTAQFFCLDQFILAEKGLPALVASLIL